ncbi:hypothetical protein HOG21_06830 [bacterium]|nr:hypothetical protein [bacterium]
MMIQEILNKNNSILILLFLIFAEQDTHKGYPYCRDTPCGCPKIKYFLFSNKITMNQTRQKQ